MTQVRVKGFKIFKDRLGKQRCYHRKTKEPIDTDKYPLGTAEFFAECYRITNLFDKASKASKAKAGTLGLLMQEYKKNHRFKDLASRTRSDYMGCMDYLEPISNTPLVKFTTPLVVRIRDQAAEKHGRRFGNYIRSFLSLLFSWGYERGYISGNPAAGIRSIGKPKDAEDANRPWKDFEREAVMAALPPHMQLPIALMMYCGLDPQDAVTLPKSAIKDGYLDTKRGKTGQPVWTPLPQAVNDVMKAAPTHFAITVCANSRGMPWTVSGFQSSWDRIKKKLEAEEKIKPGLTLKGLRHTVATILSEMGKDKETIRIVLGQKTDAMAAHYSKRANHQKRMDEVVKQFDQELNRRRTEIVKPEKKSVKLK